MSGCFMSLIEGEFYDPACDALARIPKDAPEEFDPRGLAACKDCTEDLWRALRRAADARAARANGRAH
jgi:hypothetical protein